MPDRTVLHGKDQSGASIADRPTAGNMASVWYDEENFSSHLYDSTTAVWLPYQGIVQFKYDFSVDAGAIGTITLVASMPTGFQVTEGMVDVITTFTSATDAGTVALQCASAGDIVVAVAISNSGNPWDAGLQDVVPVGTAATSFAVGAGDTIDLVIAVEAVTAGKLRGVLRGFMSE
jgi:hypothetical protein